MATQINFRMSDDASEVLREWCEAHGHSIGMVMQVGAYIFACAEYDERIGWIQQWRDWDANGAKPEDLA